MSWRDMVFIRSMESKVASHNSQYSQNSPKLVDSANIANCANEVPKNNQIKPLGRLTSKERAYLLNWVASIGETNPDEIEYTLNQCESDPVAREWFLTRAYKLSLFRIGQANMDSSD
jgi:hypothetical protein